MLALIYYIVPCILLENVGLDEKLASIMEKANMSVVKQKALTAEERARKAAILAQYAHVSDGEEYP